MTRNLWRRLLSCVLGVGMVGATALLLTRTFAADKPPAPKPPSPANPQVVKVENPDLLTPYVTKSVIEVPTEQLLAARTVPAAASPGPEFMNPKVQPGKVHWHKDFAAACRAAKKSGKPVLLFQMMGNLDDRFC